MPAALPRALVALVSAVLLFATAASAGPYGWTLSASNTDPLQNTGSSGVTSTTVYLWLACDAANEGVSSAEFGVFCSRTISSFTPSNGFTNSGTPDQPRLAISGCPTGPRLAGSFAVGTLLGASFNMCLVASSRGRNETVTCGGHTYPNDVVGFTTDGSTPCGDPAALCATADLGVAISVDNNNPRALAPFKYTISVTNGGTVDASGVHVIDPIASPLVYQSYTATRGTYSSGTGIWNVGALAHSETMQLEITVHAGAGSTGNVVWNTATRLASAPFDPDTTNDADSVSVTIAAPPQADLRLTKTVAPARVCEGDSAVFTIVVHNGGPDPGTSVQAIDLLPAGMTYVSQTATQGSYDSSTGIWTVGNVAVADSATLALTVTLDAGTAGTSLWNRGAIAGSNQADGIASNDVDSTAVAVRATGSTATFESVTTSPATATDVHLDLGDDSEIADATLFYRNGGAATFDSLAMTRGASGVWDAVVPAVDVGHAGLQCYAQVTSTCASTRVPSAGLTNISCRVQEDSTFVLPAGKYSLLGVPFVADDVTPTGLFDELAPYDTQRWRYGTWNGTAYGDGPGQAKNAAAGQGFWIYDATAATIGSTGWTTNLAQDFVRPLSPGWNQIANPFKFPIAFTQLGRPNGISDDLVAYDGAGYVHFTSTLEPGRGYWIRNTTGGTINLAFPASPAPAPAPARRAVTAIADGWEIGLSVVAGAARDEGNVLGMRRDAKDDDDANDYAEAPAPPGDYLVASFRDAAGRSLQTDFRTLRQPGASWDLNVASTLAGASFQIVVALPQSLPDGWQAVVLDPTGLGSFPVTDGAVIEGGMLLAPEAQEWHVVSGTPAYVAERTRAVQAGVGAAALDLAVAPNPFADRTVLTLTLPHADVARLRIYDVGGRLVRDLDPGFLPAGFHRFVWNPATGSARAAAGVYFIRLSTSTGQLARKVVVR
ncbi:MAG: T9SS type A sorting domain-containing protein [bacterium]